MNDEYRFVHSRRHKNIEYWLTCQYDSSDLEYWMEIAREDQT